MAPLNFTARRVIDLSHPVTAATPASPRTRRRPWWGGARHGHGRRGRRAGPVAVGQPPPAPGTTVSPGESAEPDRVAAGRCGGRGRGGGGGGRDRRAGAGAGAAAV